MKPGKTILFCALALGWPLTGEGDVLLPGHKNVKHELVFEDSELLRENRLVAAPIAGFSGAEVIKAGTPFRFSSKYGTRFYLIPGDTPVPKFDQDVFAQWPNCKPPRGEIRSVPVSNPVASALTTLRFTEIGDSGPVIEEVGHVELDRFGEVASPTRSIIYFGLLIAAGLVLCLVAIRRMKSSGSKDSKVGVPDTANPDGVATDPAESN